MPKKESHKKHKTANQKTYTEALGGKKEEEGRKVGGEGRKEVGREEGTEALIYVNILGHFYCVRSLCYLFWFLTLAASPSIPLLFLLLYPSLLVPSTPVPLVHP